MVPQSPGLIFVLVVALLHRSRLRPPFCALSLPVIFSLLMAFLVACLTALASPCAVLYGRVVRVVLRDAAWAMVLLHAFRNPGLARSPS